MTEVLSAEQVVSLQRTVEAWCATQDLPPQLDAAERLAQAVGRVVTATTLAAAVTQWGPRLGYVGPTLACACHHSARFVGHRSRWLRGIAGEVQVSRAYYHCSHCHTGQCPWDHTQGLDRDAFTPTLKAELAYLSSHLVYREAQAVWARLTGQSLCVSQVETGVRQVGARLRAAETARCTRLFADGVLPPADPFAATVVGQRAYLCVDGTHAYTDGSPHEVKVAVFFRGEPPVPRRAATAPGDTAGPGRYLALEAEAADFGKRLYSFALPLGCERARELVILGDGAPWIWNLADQHFSDARQILDFYHAAEHVWRIARAVFAEDDPAGDRWAHTCTEALRTGGWHGLRRCVRTLRPLRRTAAQRRAVGAELAYFRRHRRRLDYPRYREEGLLIGSGPVEAACKSVVGQRLKGTGMRWSRDGADAILAVRTAVLGHEEAQLAWAARAA